MAIKNRYDEKTTRALSMWLKLSRAHDTIYYLLQEYLRQYDLTPKQFQILECIGHLGPMLMGDLAKKQLTTCGNITVIVNNLAALGLVKRVVNKEDKRAFYIHLTPKGEKLFKKLFKPTARYITTLASVLTDNEQESLAELAKKLGTSVEEKYKS